MKHVLLQSGALPAVVPAAPEHAVATTSTIQLFQYDRTLKRTRARIQGHRHRQDTSAPRSSPYQGYQEPLLLYDTISVRKPAHPEVHYMKRLQGRLQCANLHSIFLVRMVPACAGCCGVISFNQGQHDAQHDVV
jgi:hypothetical protein